jgi:peroxiredoxin (alkyl hydroperoxide reductase subunit C)
LDTATPSFSIPRLNEPAPDFEAQTTFGVKRLSEFTGAGKWVVLFSHPADFTPVCSTEMMAYAQAAPEFEKRNTQILGLSIDSIYAHLAWMRDLEEGMGVKVPFPVIADLDMKVASLYGMLHPGASSTATVRAVFFIDPARTLRAMIYYPLTTGRSIPELLRVLDSLQTADKFGVSTPVNWQPGEETVVPAPQTMDSLATEEAKKDAYTYKRWYLRLKQPDGNA